MKQLYSFIESLTLRAQELVTLWFAYALGIVDAVAVPCCACMCVRLGTHIHRKMNIAFYAAFLRTQKKSTKNFFT